MPTGMNTTVAKQCGLSNQKRFVMKAIVFFREDDDKIINDYINSFMKYSDQKLVDAYNKEARCGIVGVHRQTLYLYALREVMRERFKHSTIFFESNIMGMQGEVKLIDGKVWFK